jgi:hypothetical protein
MLDFCSLYSYDRSSLMERYTGLLSKLKVNFKIEDNNVSVIVCVCWMDMSNTFLLHFLIIYSVMTLNRFHNF